MITYDPMTQRLCGLAMQGHTPFDVPCITPITDTLWQGGCVGDMVLPNSVEHLVSLCDYNKYTIKHRLKSHLTYVLSDDNHEVDSDRVVALASWVNECRITGITLVHCQMGLNRSGLIVGAALVMDGMRADDAIALMREKRTSSVLCNKTFALWLLGYGRSLGR